MYNYTQSRPRGSEERLEICSSTGPMATLGSERTCFCLGLLKEEKKAALREELPGDTACYHMKEDFITLVQWAEQ